MTKDKISEVNRGISEYPQTYTIKRTETIANGLYNLSYTTLVTDWLS